jgi:assimilatory nitrate reductase electron transfer subunit
VTAPSGQGRRIVLVGHGLVGHRFCEEIRRRGGPSPVVLSAEPRPYNRVLLPSVLSGALAEDETVLPASGGDVRGGVAATGIDLARRSVTTSAGDEVRYDALVLATGARARIPGVPGITAGEPPGLARDVAVLRTLGDARRLNALARAARRAGGRIVVLGGGVLGLEAARALAARGTAVTVVHPKDTVMERQVDGPGGRILAAALRRTGVDIELGVRASRWESGRGLWVGEGERLIPATGLLVSAGTVPETALARDAGLRLADGGGIAIDDTLITSHPAVHAIGDCAGYPCTVGLVQPGWEQAAVLARRLTGDGRARYRGSTAVTRLKAAGIELTCLGDGLSEDPDHEILRFEDAARERYAKLVISGDRIAGAIMIGLPDAAAAITQLYDQGAPAPADRLALLLGRALPPETPGAAGPAALPDHAIVCRCNMVTKATLRDAWHRGATSKKELSCATRAATGCGTCGDDVEALATWMAETDHGHERAAVA